MAKKKAQDVSEDTNTVPALVVSPNKAPVITGNFEDMEAYLVRTRDKYANVELSTAVLPDVLRIKAEMRTLRTSTEKIEKETVNTFFNNPKKIIQGNFSRLYNIIAEVESRCDEVIAEEDEKRIEGINLAINAYCVEAGFADLRDEFQEHFIREKSWYNKTANEADVRNAVIAQVSSLLKEQKAYDGNIRLIDKACNAEPRLSRRMLLDMLDSGGDIASVLDVAEQETKRLEKVDEEARQTAQAGEVAEEVSYPAGDAMEEDSLEAEASEIDFASDLPTRVKRVVVEITYPADCGDAMTQLFALLHKKGIKSKVVG